MRRPPINLRLPQSCTSPPFGGSKSFLIGDDRLCMKFRFYYTGIRVRDLERSLTFYRGVLGMRIIGRGTMPHRGRYVHLRGRGSPQRLELNWYPKGSRFFTRYQRGEELDHLAFVVDDVKKAYEELIRSGAKPAVSPLHPRGRRYTSRTPTASGSSSSASRPPWVGGALEESRYRRCPVCRP